MDAAKSMASLRELDRLHLIDNPLTRRHPLAHTIVTAAFLVFLLSGGKYEVSGLLPFLFYPLSVLLIADIPFPAVARRVLFVLPVILFIGIWNPLFDRQQFLLGALSLSAGWVSFLSLMLKGVFAVAAALLFVSVAGMEGIVSALRALRVPRLLTTQLSFTYRYIFVFGEEVIRTLTAYRLRAPDAKGVSMKHFGSLAGGLFLHAMKRANDIYAAMRCRGFSGNLPSPLLKKAFQPSDLLYALLWTAFFALCRFFNLPDLLGSLFV